MVTLIFLAGLIVIAIGLVAKYWLDQRRSEFRITLPEFGIAAAVMLAIVIPTTSWVGMKLAFSNAVTYEEYWSGYEVDAVWVRIECYRDGPCIREYECDPYQVWVVDRPAYTDDKGRYHPEQGHYETRYHDCPYTTEEWTFKVRTTLGDYLIASHNLPTNPDQHRWRRGKAVPNHYPSGIPEHWQQVKDRLNQNKPGPVTARRNYENYILASQHTILKKFSADIDRYKQQNLLPAINTNIHNHYLADRVYFVGVPAPGGNAGLWQWHSRYFNGAFGLDLQGDLHVVIVDANKITNPDNYIGALAAYWQSPDFGKQALSKNGLIVVLGTTDGTTVAWARGITGMPKGNEALLIDIRDQLTGTQLTPAAIYGPPTGELYVDPATNDVKVRIHHSQGALDRILWGTNKFTRVKMTDYEYLSHEIEPTGGQKALIIFFNVLFGCIAWGICIHVGPQTFHRYRRFR
jgi:hypothetical protein